MATTRLGYAAMAAAGLAVVYGGIMAANHFGLIGHSTSVKSAVPDATKAVNFTVADKAPVYDLPVTAKYNPMADCPTVETIPWNAVGPLILANGGASTARGSLLDKFTGGGCMTIKRQDDYNQMYANLASFIQFDGSKGDMGFVIMGDAYPYVSAALDKAGLKGKYVAVYAFGFSNGEDKAMGPPDLKNLIQQGKGPLVAAVPRDGDWNLWVKWASDNGIPINVDQKTYNPHAVNFTDVDAFTTADQKLLTHAVETRQIVDSDGVTHGKEIQVVVNATATWTPGDINVVTHYDSPIVSEASTADYPGQMPSLFIVAKAWAEQHRDYIVGVLKAADRASVEIRNTPDGLTRMGIAEATVYQDKFVDAEGWARYFKGMVGRGGVPLGGTRAITLQEARDYFGLGLDPTDTFASVFRVFKGYDETYYPVLYPKTGDGSIPAYEDVMDFSYLRDALKGVAEMAAAPKQIFTEQRAVTQVVSSKSWHIEFATGSAEFKPEALKALNDIKDTAIFTSLRMQVDGYTDNTGSAAVNTALSQARADAVAHWLTQQAPSKFPAARFIAQGHGSDNPICSANDTAVCKAQNRRVDITMGN